MKISIDLELGPQYEQDEDGDFHPVDPAAFDDQILELVATKLLARVRPADQRSLEKLVSTRLEQLIDESIEERVTEILSGPLRKHDYLGKPSGPTFTVSEMIVAAVESFANAPAGRDGYGNKAPANLAELVNATVAEAIRKDLADDITEIRRSVAKEIRDRLKGVTAEAIVKGR